MTSPTLSVSIHAPREGSDHHSLTKQKHLNVFQSTLPVKGATSLFIIRGSASPFQSTLPVKGATAEAQRQMVMEIVSIHAPREGSDHHYTLTQLGKDWFQSTLPVKGATWGLSLPEHLLVVSIHAPREGSDSRVAQSCAGVTLFQSTLPVKGAT